jgi:predicted acetylornithine/succinylornithine family transaminase
MQEKNVDLPGAAMTVLEREAALMFQTYRRLPLAVHRGEGVFLVADDGRRYLDMVGGIAVNALGYGHPAVVNAICDQARRYVHLSNYFAMEPQVRLAEALTRATGHPRVFFGNSGTEVVEGAVKIARKWGARHGKTEIVSLAGAFHGRTFGALSLMDRASYRDGFGPFLDGFHVVPHNDVATLRRAVSGKTAAVIVECIQGEGGIRPLGIEFASALSELHTRNGFLLIADEIQSGIGRTGEFCAYEHFGLKPDIVLLAKPLGGGLPLGAILAREEIAAVLQPGSHGTTFGGNPVACAAGYAVVEAIRKENLMDNARKMGKRLMDGLGAIASRFPKMVREVRGLGLMVGLELNTKGDPFVAATRERGVLINCTDQTVLRFLPPLTIEPDHIDATLAAVEESIASAGDAHA